jgi:hypothetical protein
LLGKFHLEPRGADFVAHNGRSFAASDDEWTSPICAEVGPDSALWVIDWYNYIIQHNPTPIGKTTGKGNAYETPLRDKTHGRIYRVVYKNATPSPGLRLDRASADELASTLQNNNLLWRMTAQRLLVERGSKDVVSALCKLVQHETTDEIGLNPSAIHAMWTLRGLGALEHPEAAVAKAVESALTHASAGVRRAAINVAPRDDDWLKKLLDHKLLEDVDAQVRLATLLAISEMPTSKEAGLELSKIREVNRAGFLTTT